MSASQNVLRSIDDDFGVEEYESGATATRSIGGDNRSRAGAKRRPAMRPTVMYALIAIAAVGVVGAIQLAVSLALAQGSYEIAALTNKSTQLSRSTQSLREELTVLESPQYLAEQADKLGMQSSASSTFIRLSDGKKIKTVATLSNAYQQTADTYAMTISGNLIANSNLSTSAAVTTGVSSAVGATKEDLDTAFTSLIGLAQAATSDDTTSTNAAQPQAAVEKSAQPPMSSTTHAEATEAAPQQSLQSAENSTTSGAAKQGTSSGELTLSANQMPTPNSR